MIRKLVINDGLAEREILLTETVVVGRDPSCAIHDMDPLLSRRHAEFVLQPTGPILVRDLRSRNGILVNGEKVRESPLAPGDVIQLGHLHVRYLEELAPPPQPSKTPPEVRPADPRTHATTAAGLEVPTMAPGTLPRGAHRPSAAPPMPTHGRATDPSPGDNEPTIAVGSWPIPAVDNDATRMVGTLPDLPAVPPSAVHDASMDATIAPASFQSRAPVVSSVPSDSSDVTVAPSSRKRDGGAAGPGLIEAHVIADGRLIVTEASPSCLALFGVHPEAFVGHALPDVLLQALKPLSGGGQRTITITFRAEPAIETEQ